MPFVARYHALKDFPETLPRIDKEKGLINEAAYDFDPPNDIVLEDSGPNMPYLSFRLDPSNDANGLKVEVLVKNGTTFDEQIFSITLSGTVSRTINELFPGSLIRKGQVNKIKFKVTGGIGTVDVSDVIMWFIRSG